MKRRTVKEIIEVSKKINKLAQIVEQHSEIEEKAATKKLVTGQYNYYKENAFDNNRYSAQLKRTSMELTKLLADLRLNR